MPKAERLIDKAYRGILKLVEDGHFRGQENLTFSGLSDRLRMSRMPVTIAIDRLQRDGILESIPRLGTRVRSVDAEAIWGLLRWRVALESEIAREASLEMSDNERKHLIEVGIQADQQVDRASPELAQLRKGVVSKQEDPEAFVRLVQSISPIRLGADFDDHFHLVLAGFSGAPRLQTELERLMQIAPVKLAICETVAAAAAYAIPSEMPPDHETVARIIAKGDPNKAARVMCDHIENGFFIFGFQQWYRQWKRRRTREAP